MKWLSAFVLLSVSHLAVARVFRQPLKPALTPRTNYIRQEIMADALGRERSNVTVEYMLNAFEWYLIDVAVGTPPQNFTVLFDTGSPYLWVTDSRCKNSSDEGHGTSDEDTSCPPEPVPGYKRRTFKDDASSTLVRTEQKANCCYGAGCAYGIFATDVFTTAGVQVENMTTGLVDAMRHEPTDSLPNTPFDGVFGAWLNESTFEGFRSSIQQVLRQTDKQLFTIALSGHVGQKAGSGGGFVTYGALDDINCAKDWNYVDAGELGSFWTVLVDGVSYGSSSESEQTLALFDTGIPRLAIRSSLVKKIASDSKAERDANLGVYVVDCDVKGLPDIVLTIGGHKYPIPSKEYIIDIEFKPGKCVLNLDETDGDVIAGDPFYRTFCTSYDYAKKRVGFAKSLI